MREKKKAVLLIIISLLLIPYVHIFAPMFYAEVPEKVATNSGSIIGQTNVYAQLFPYVLAYLFSPVMLIIGGLKLLKSKRGSQKQE
jgi:hypothetical protein